MKFGAYLRGLKTKNCSKKKFIYKNGYKSNYETKKNW